MAAVQAAPVFMNESATTEKSVALIEKAAQQGAALIACGEAWRPGYPLWVWPNGVFANNSRGRSLGSAPYFHKTSQGVCNTRTMNPVANTRKPPVSAMISDESNTNSPVRLGGFKC